MLVLTRKLRLALLPLLVVSIFFGLAPASSAQETIPDAAQEPLPVPTREEVREVAATVETEDPVAELPPAPDAEHEQPRAVEMAPQGSAVTASSETQPEPKVEPRQRIDAATQTPSSRPGQVTPPAIITSPGSAIPSGGWQVLDAPRANPAEMLPTDKPASSVTLPFSNEPLRVLAARKNLALPLPAANVVIDKSERRLDLYSGRTLVKSYRVALGENPVGHKLRQGDSRTPEGHFYICTRNSKTSAFHIFLGLSYPGIPDAKRAVDSNQITWREYQVIHQRLASRGRPLWETNLGGWVGIHGGTDAAFAAKKRRERGKPDWTAGCIALTNREIEEIHAATKLGTPVEVKP